MTRYEIHEIDKSWLTGVVIRQDLVLCTQNEEKAQRELENRNRQNCCYFRSYKLIKTEL